jgi:hypothetical protein
MSGTAPISAEQVALMRRRVSIIVGSRDAAQRPHLMRALGCRIDPDLRQVTVFMGCESARAVLEDVQANGRIAVVFSEPTTHRSVQLKGDDAALRPLEPGDAAIIEDHRRRFGEEIGLLGFPLRVAQTLLEHGECVAVRFTPQAAFDQTPGPHAGAALTPG